MALYKICYDKMTDAAAKESILFCMIIDAADPKTAFEAASTALGIKIPGEDSTGIVGVENITEDAGAQYFEIDYMYNKRQQTLVEHGSSYLDAYNQAMVQINKLAPSDDCGIMDIRYIY